MSSVSEVKEKKVTNFNEEWELLYLCKASDGYSVCLVCKKQILCKLFNIRRHYDNFHSSYDKFNGDKRSSLYLSLSAGIEVNKKKEQVDKASAIRASYEIALQLVRENHAFKDGEFIKKCLMTAVKYICKEDLPKYEAICLSRRTITRRVEEMAQDCERQLEERIKIFSAVSVALDESTDVTDIAQLAIFIRGVDESFEVTEELLDIVPMKGTTTAEDILNCFNDVVKRMGVPLNRLVCVATDGAPSMRGCKSGFVTKLRNKLQSEHQLNDDFIAIHCLVHQEALCAKSIGMSNVMSVVTKCVNIIRAHGLNHRQFKEFLESVESEHIDIPYYTEIRWLSRGKTLKRFFELKEYIIEFLEEKQNLPSELRDITWAGDLAFLTDITQHLNDLNIALLGRNKLLCHMYDEIEAFKKKLALWRRQIENGQLHLFPCLNTISQNHDINTSKYIEELLLLESEFNERFAELHALKYKFEVFLTPFSVDAFDAPIDIQLELINLQCDTRLKSDYKEAPYILEFYKNLCPDRFPKLRALVINIIAMFGSTYSCEQFFSIMKLNKSLLRNRISDNSLGYIMRLASGKEILPNIDLLASRSAH